MSRGYLIDRSISFEPKNYKISIDGNDVRLSQKECQVLEILCINSNIVVERNLFIEPIWGSSASGDIGLNKSILLLRRKFESYERPDLINTVPRVGYTLNAEVAELSYTENNSSQPEQTSPQDIPETEAVGNNNILHNWRRRNTYIAMTLSLIALLASTYYTWLSDDEKPPIVRSKIQNGNNITYTSNIHYDAPIMEKTSAYLSNKKGYYFRALISTEILSFILYENETPINQKVFLINQKRAMKEQLSCLDDYLSIDNNVKKEPASDLKKGMMYSKKDFYSECDEKGARKLGVLYTKGTRLAHGVDENHMMLQDFLLRGPTGEEIFHIKRYVNHLGFGTEHMNIVQKSVMSDNINLDLIHTNELYSSLLSELTKDNVIHTRIEPQLYVSDIFDGMLFYSKEYH